MKILTANHMNGYRRWWLGGDGGDFFLFAQVRPLSDDHGLVKIDLYKNNFINYIAGIRLDADELKQYHGIGKPYLDFMSNQMEVMELYKSRNIPAAPYVNILLNSKDGDIQEETSMQLVMHDPKIEMNHFNQWWLIKDGADFILFAEVERSAATGCAGIKLTEDEVEHYKGIGKPYLDFLARRLQAGVYADNNVAWDPAYRQILYPKEQSS